MEKLIELLNEYDGEDLEYGFIDGEIRRKVRNFDNERNTWKQVVWYTKHFGFIQRLVDNDKIDLEKYKDKSELYTLKVVHGTDYYIDLLTNKVNSDFLLMLLSISSSPIEDLISYLKK